MSMVATFVLPWTRRHRLNVAHRRYFSSLSSWTIRSLSELDKDGNNRLIQDVARRLDSQVDLLSNRLGKEDDKKAELGEPISMNNDADRTRCTKIQNDLIKLHTSTRKLCDDALIYDEKKQPKSVISIFKQIHARHAGTIENMAEWTILMRRQHQLMMMQPVLKFLERRLDIQFLCERGMSDDNNHDHDDDSSFFPLRHVVDDAALEASHLCEAQYLASPNVEIEMAESSNSSDTPRLIRPWLHYVLVEIFKNGMAATVERYQTEGKDDDGNEDDDDEDALTERLPSIRVIIEEHDQESFIRIHDQGGGGDDDGVIDERVFEFAQRTEIWDRVDDQTTYAATRSPLRGLGVGLSMSRMLMRRINGDVTIEEHHQDDDEQRGCTVTIRLSRDVDKEILVD